MKKRFAALMLFLAIALSGCSTQAQSISVITLYYPYQNNVQDKSSAIGYETRTIDGEDKLKAAVEAISGNPQNSNLKSIFSSGVSIQSYKVTEGTINLYMSDAYTDMPLGSKALARACLALTLCGIKGVSSVSIYIGDIPDVKNFKSSDVVTENVMVPK